MKNMDGISAAAADHKQAGLRNAAGGASPSLIRHAPALVLLAIVVADCGRYADTDLWGHIFFGNVLLSHGPYLGGDRFSYSAAGYPWHNHEWLCESLMALLYNAFGVLGLKFWKFGCTAMTILFVAAAEGETGAPMTVQFAVLITSAFTLAPLMQFRPQSFSFVLFAALLAGLTRDNYGRRAPLWLAIPGLALWANLHGAFFLGILTLAIYTAVAGLLDIIAGRGLRHAIGLGAMTITGAAATLATPYGLNTWYTVTQSVTNPDDATGNGRLASSDGCYQRANARSAFGRHFSDPRVGDHSATRY